MSRPTGGQLTTAGFTNTAGTRYEKAATASKAVVDIVGNVNGGFVQITTTTPGSPVTLADWNSHKGTMGSVGVPLPAVEDLQGLQSYSASV